MPVGRIIQIRAAALFEIDDDSKPVEQHVLTDNVENIGYRTLFCLRFTTASRRNRVREHGRRTHLSRVAFAARLVNRCRAWTAKPKTQIPNSKTQGSSNQKASKSLRLHPRNEQ